MVQHESVQREVSREEKVRFAKECFGKNVENERSSFSNTRWDNDMELGEEVVRHSDKTRRYILAVRMVAAFFLFIVFVAMSRNQVSYQSVSADSVRQCLQDEQYVNKIEGAVKPLINKIIKWGHE